MARRKTEAFSLAFLDVIACGFGAIVLFYTILSAQAGVQRQQRNDDLQAEVDRLEDEVLDGYKNLVVLRNSLDSTDEAVPAEGLAERVIAETERLRQQLAEAEQDTLSKRETIERLKQDLRSLEEGNRRLNAGTPDPGKPGTRIKGFVGSGDRQYLTGLKVGGERILVLVDVSASMMDDSVVNVIRMRNMPESRRMAAAKWRRTVATVDWLMSQLPASAKFQAYAFNTQPRALVAGSEGRWLDAGDAQALSDVLRELRRTVPRDGTSLENVFTAALALSPRPDNIILVTDGLPTQGASPPAVRTTIDGEGRLKLFEKAIARLPRGVPVNVILLPMEGDPLAPGAYWTLARRTSGVPEPGEGLAVKRSRRGRRDVEVFSLSFLDAICCGFGAVILLLVLTEVGEPVVFEQSRAELQGRVLELQQQLAEIRGTSEVLNRDLEARRMQLSEEQQKIARLRGDLSALRGQYESSRKDAEVANQIEGRLVLAQQDMTEEQKRLLGAQFRRRDDSPIGGVPVDSEYIIFIIDTSGSMANYAWPLMLAKMQEVLDAHPTVKGWQVMNDEGGYMFSGFRGRWLPDTPAQRKIVLDRLRDWFPFSNSSPVEGIVEAIRTYYASGLRISLYVLGDEFTGSSIDSVVRAVDTINREDKSGQRRVRIHAIGFPVRPDAPQYTSVRFATLMRILCDRNGGTFVGLNEPGSYRR